MLAMVRNLINYCREQQGFWRNSWRQQYLAVKPAFLTISFLEPRFTEEAHPIR
jgi:hypothetical protein